MVNMWTIKFEQIQIHQKDHSWNPMKNLIVAISDTVIRKVVVNKSDLILDGRDRFNEAGTTSTLSDPPSDHLHLPSRVLWRGQF